ncbi:hypothetical protein AB9K17_23745, partial [Salmonella enterica subsp. enterica serovar Kentucky]|uniref:hypothetical protein n=1 Tax=Salmonella enterica TaxID=28901 RepID=UPI003F4C2E3F
GSIEQRMNIPNTCSHDLQEETNPGHYDKICWYERVSHYEKAPHCHLTLKKMGDEQGPPP